MSEMYLHTFTEDLFRRVGYFKYQVIGDWKNKLWYGYTIENHEVIKGYVTEEYLMTWKTFAVSDNKRLKHRL